MSVKLRKTNRNHLGGHVKNSESNLKQFRQIGFEDAESWMEQRLARMRTGIPNSVAVATEMASNWAHQLNLSLGDLDKRIAEIEATNLAHHYTLTHVSCLGNMEKLQPDGMFRLIEGQSQMSSTSSTDAHRQIYKVQ